MKRKKTLANALLLARVMRRSPQHPLARGQVRDTTNTEAASDAVAAQSEVDRLTRLTRSRERHATQSRRKREETQMQIDTLRQDCGRLNASNLHLWHHNKVGFCLFITERLM